MRKQSSLVALLAAVAFAVPPVFGEGPKQGDNQSQQHDKSAQASQGSGTMNLRLPGVQARDEVEREGVYDLLGTVTEAALSGNGIEDVVERFVDQDRNRFGRYLENDQQNQVTAYNQAVAQFQENWQKKYNQGFGVENEEQVFQSVQAVQGEIIDAAAFAKTWPVTTTGTQPNPDDQAALASFRDDDETGLDNQLQSNLENGREVAVATLTRSGDQKPINISMLKEFPGVWRVDVPNNVNGPQLMQALTMRVEELNRSMDQWPQDVQQAQSYVAAELLSAVVGVPANQTPQAQQQQMQRNGSGQQSVPQQRDNAGGQSGSNQSGNDDGM